ncbi:RPA family protein [Natrinema sp. JCM 9743]
MSTTESDDDIPGREIAYRLFAAEYDDASLSYAESDEERAPNYVITPTGARLNRVFVVGTLTEVTSVNDEMVRARVVDPTGAFVVYAGQYQPDELAFLEQTEPPAFVAVTGKARTFQPDDSDQVYTSIRPESIAAVDADTRDRWVVSAAERTIDRIGTYAGAAALAARTEHPDAGEEAVTDALLEAGVDAGLAAGIPLAQDHYGTTPSYLAALRNCALEACEVVAGDRDQVNGLEIAPDATSPEFDATVASLADLDGVDIESLGAAAAESGADADAAPMEPVAAGEGGTATDPEDAHSGSAAGTATSDGTETAAVDVESEPDPDALEPGEADGSGADDPTVTDETDESETAAGAAEMAADEPAVDSDPVGDEVDSDDALEAAPAATTGDDGGAADDVAESVSDDVAESVSDDGDDELGDFDAGDVDDSMYEMDEEEREQLEEEFGAEFTTGTEVEDPGEADIDVPEPEDVDGDEPAAESKPDADEPAGDDGSGEAVTGAADDPGAPPESGLETEGEPASDPDAGDDAETEATADIDLEAYVVETMSELDDGDGAERTAVIERVAADTGASADDVENAIQDALMGGQCYEPDDETLKAI